MACRNEADYLPTCLHHLVRNGLEFAIVDNGSTDGSISIARSAEFRPFLVDVRHAPFNGTFELDMLLQAKRALAESIGADWVMNICPDEILHPNRQGTTLAEEVAQFDRAGFNVVNFDEFVFLPVERAWQNGHRGWPDMRHYYFFEPSRFRQMRLWKPGQGLSNVRHGGHRLDGDKRFAPESLVLRHYLFKSQQHAFEKFPQRHFAPEELARGWHRNRHGYPPAQYAFPPIDRMDVLDHPESTALSRARPWKKHYWEHREAAANIEPRTGLR